MTTKAEFLARLHPSGSPRPVETPADVAYAPFTPGVDGFVAAFEELGGTTDRIDDASAVAEAVARYVGARRPVLTVEHPDLARVRTDLRWPSCSIADAATAAVGVVVADAAIAMTGSVAVSATTNKGRCASLLPPACVFVIRASDIVDTPGEVLRPRGDDPPSQLVLVTGPSRSADIEFVLTVGVHGPGHVHAVVIA